MKRFGLVLFLLMRVLTTQAAAREGSDESESVVFLGDNGVIVLKFEIRLGETGTHETAAPETGPRTTFEQSVDRLMQTLDKDGNGIVTAEEAQGRYLTSRDLQLVTARVPAGNPQLVAEPHPDVTPADGKITRHEFLAYFKRIGLFPFQMNYQPNIAAPAMTRQGRPATGSPSVPLFARLDTNGDGKLSSSELTDALKTLHKLDLDDDETISLAELNPVGNGAGLNAMPANGARNPVKSPFLGMGPDESISKQIRRLIDKYDSVDPLKSGVEAATVRNQKLSRQELGLSVASFARFDGDGDDQLDFDELRQFLSDPDSTIQILVPLDRMDPLAATADQPELQKKLKITPDGSANINLGSLQFSIVRNPSFAPLSVDVLLKQQFMAADTDANGYLEKFETERIFLLGVPFESLDTDQNDKIFLDELLEYFSLRLESARSRVVLTIQEQGRTLFEILDTDRDQRLSFRELQVAADRLSLWDQDGDGELKESEVPLQYRLVLVRGNLPGFGNGFLNPNLGMNPQGIPAERTGGPVWFLKMDKNRDGEVSSREFLGELSLFAEIDRNHDGFIDLNEAALAEGSD